MYESFSFKKINTKNLNSIVSRICEQWETTFGQYQDIVRVADGYIQVDTELKGGNIAVVQIFAQAWIPTINCIQLLTTDTMGNKRYTMLDPTTYQLYFQGGELKIPISRFIIQDLDATPPEQYEKENTKKYDIKKDVDVELEEARKIFDTIEETFPSSAYYYIRKTNKKLNEHEENIKCLWKTIRRMQEEIKQQNY